MLRLPLACAALTATVMAAVTPLPGRAAGTTRPPVVKPHAAFDETTAPAPRSWQRGARVGPFDRFKIPLLRGANRSGLAPPEGGRPDPEVLGFAQVDEVTSGAWTSDLRFDLLSTVAYFGVNVNSDGTLVTDDAGWAGWQSQQLTSLMTTAHAAGDRVVLTVKAFDDSTIASVTGSETTRQTLIAQIVGQLEQRGGDGVNIDFEGTDPSVSSNFTTFISELYSALQSQVPQQSYLTVDTFASAGLGGTMYDLSGLTPHLDAFDLMGYGFETGGEASPSAPLHGDWYNVTQAVTDYLSTYGVPPSKLILGVPYYGYKWSVANPNPGNDGEQAGSNASADTYAGALSDFSCAEQLQQFWDPTFDEPYATWWSPGTNDPCGGNWNSHRELYYENAQSLGMKYDLVNTDGLRGIGIWALGYDSGSNDLWNEIAAKFSVTHGPLATVSALPQTEASTGFTVSWANSGSTPVGDYVLWVQPDTGRWQPYVTTTATSTTVFGFPGHSYGFYVQAIGTNGYNSGGPAAPQATTSVSSSATWSETAFHTMYAVNGWGALQPGSSPVMSGDYDPGWNIFRGVALDSSGNGGVTLDGWGGLHPFGDAGSATNTFYWAGWDINVGLAATMQNQGYVLDAWGGLHPFGMDGASPPPAAVDNAYWYGWNIARDVALFGDGSGGVVLDGWGGVHPFGVSGGAAPAPAHITGYWYGWDIARSLVLLPGSTSQRYGGYVLDGWGGLHPFGTAGDVPPNLQSGSSWPGWDIARGLVLLPGSSSAGYVTDAFGGMHPFGGAPAVVSGEYTPGDYLTRGLAIH